MRTVSTLIALLAIAAVALASDAFAQTVPCFPLESVIDTNNGQTLAWTGVTPTRDGTARMMLFQSPDGSWTLFAVHGILACLIGFGREGEAVAVGLPI